MTDNNAQQAGIGPSPSPGTGIGAPSADDQQIPLAPVVAGPWPRYWGRTFDLTLLVFVLSVAVAFLAPSVAAKLPGLWLGFLLIPVAVMIESALYRISGSTPGKWLLGLKVLSTQGRRLAFHTILQRNFRAYWSGLGLGIPIVTFFTLLNAHAKARRGEPQSWDSGTASRCYAARGSTTRTWIGAALTISLVVGVRTLGAYAETPKGALEVAALAVNARAPQQIDEGTRLDGAVASENRFQYLYTLTKYDPAAPGASGDLDRRRSRLFVRVHDGVCKGEDMKPLREAGATVQYTYRDVTAATILDIVIAPNDCLTNGSVLAAAAEINAIAPKQLDEITRLDGASASGNTIQYLYTLTTYDPAQVDAKAFATAKLALAVQLKDRACTQDDFKWLRDAGATVTFTYRDRSGSTLIDIVVPPEQCR